MTKKEIEKLAGKIEALAQMGKIDELSNGLEYRGPKSNNNDDVLMAFFRHKHIPCDSAIDNAIDESEYELKICSDNFRGFNQISIKTTHAESNKEQKVYTEAKMIFYPGKSVDYGLELNKGDGEYNASSDYLVVDLKDVDRNPNIKLVLYEMIIELNEALLREEKSIQSKVRRTVNTTFRKGHVKPSRGKFMEVYVK